MKKYLVWDLPTRLFHWLLVAAIAGQWLTAELLDDAIEWHLYLGYFTLGLILFRIIWGFVGTRHARFSDFIRSPATVLNYAKTVTDNNSKAYAGHNPMGGLMVVVLIGLVGLQAVSGLFITDDVLTSGPYHSAVSSELADTMSWVHHNCFDWLMVAVGLHLLAIIWYRVIKKQALVRAMFDGKKEVEQAQQIPSSRLWLALVLVIAVACFIYWLVIIAPPVSSEEIFYY